MEKTLQEFAKSKSNFVSIKDGESCSAVYKGYKFIEKDSFGETKEYARYLLEDLEDKQVRNLDSQSASLADQFSKIKEDTKVKITRTGEGMDTKYEVEVLDDNKFPVDNSEIPIQEDENS